MIRLNNTPNEGSTVKVNLGFRDSAGQYYIPAKITYTFLALNNDMESWSVVDNLYEVALTPASSVTLTIPDVKTITGTTLSRKVMVYWDAFVDNQYSSFTDEITFDIAPKPYIPNPPSPQPEPTIYVNINSVSLQVGTLVAAPVMPVFLIKTSLPVKIDTAIANIKTGDYGFPCNISVDEAGGTVTVSTDNELSYLTSYTLEVEGLVSTINGYEMKEPLVLSFVTMKRETPPYVPVIQDDKEVYINRDGSYDIGPDEGYDALKNVSIDVDIPFQTSKIISVTENGRHEIRPDAEYEGLRRAVIDVNVPGGGEPEQSKELTVTENGHQTILPDEGYTLSSVDLTVDVFVPAVEGPKSMEITSNGTMEIKPASGYDAIEKVDLRIRVPGAKEEQEKSVTITENGTTSVLPDEDKALSKVDITVDIQPDTQTKSVTLVENGTTTITPDTDKLLSSVDVEVAVPIETGRTETITQNGTVLIEPSAVYDAMEDVEVTVAVPLEDNKTETFTTNGEYEIVPTSGNTAMEKATVTVAVPIETGRTETYEHNGTYTISPSTGNVAIDGVEVTVDVPLETNKEVSVDIEDYTDPIEIVPTTGNDGMEKTTVTLTNMTRLYVWKDPNSNPNPHYMYTTYSDVSKCDGHAYQCGTTKNALLTTKNVEVNGEGLYVSGYPSSLYYRDPDNDMQF